VSPDQDEARVARERENLEHGFHGEEEDASTPQKDFLAAIVVGAFAVAVMVLAAQQPNPGRALTAPGLLPFITGLSLFAMAVGLALGALRAGGGRNLLSAVSASAESDSHPGRAWALLGLLVAMVVLIDALPFEYALRIGGVKVGIGAFELVSIPVLAAILRIFWRASVLRCAVSAGLTVLVFAAAFRYGFNIPLPGSG
jgi:Tripartite tricarboxylate transporter TctB family